MCSGSPEMTHYKVCSGSPQMTHYNIYIHIYHYLFYKFGCVSVCVVAKESNETFARHRRRRKAVNNNDGDEDLQQEHHKNVGCRTRKGH